MSETADPRDPNFDLRTAKPDPRYLVSDVLPRTDNRDMDFVTIRGVMQTLIDRLKARYPDETMPMFALVDEQEEAGRRVVVGFGFSHNPL